MLIISSSIISGKAYRKPIFNPELIANMKQQLYDMALKLIVVTAKDDKCGPLDVLESRLKNYMNGTYDITAEDLINQYINEENKEE